MVKQNLVDKFLSNRSYLRNGAGDLSRKWKETIGDIVDSRDEVRKQIKNIDLAESKLNSKQFVNEIVGEKDDRITGDKVLDYISNKPLSPQEIDEIAGVDNINTYVSYSWLKSHKNGTWTYSIAIKKRIADFYDEEELKERLKNLFPDVTPYILPSVDMLGNAMMTICISDDHVGAVSNKNSLYGNTWSPKEYKDRLLKIVSTIKRFVGNGYEEVHIISLGDQMNGWNSQTTRGGHEVKSVSNKEQFDAYVEGRKAFYDAIFTSEISNKYFVHEVDNSNHSGLGMSYMANQYLKLYLENKFPQVIFESTEKLISKFTFGIHTVAFTHGKDEKLMMRPMPLKLDERTDLFLHQYFDMNGHSPSKESLTFYKGDLHQSNIQSGKFGRYINIPSILGSTDYSEANFGDVKPGALIECYIKDENIISSLPIWFK